MAGFAGDVERDHKKIMIIFLEGPYKLKHAFVVITHRFSIATPFTAW